MRPYEILLTTGHRLVSTPSGRWYCHNVWDEPVTLRDLVSRVAGTLEAQQHYQQPLGFATIYAIIDEIRRAHGDHFAWDYGAFDSITLVLLDELDDVCCESRCWFTAGPPKSLDHNSEHRQRLPPSGMQYQMGIAGIIMITHAHNRRVGSTVLLEPSTEGVTPLAPFTASEFSDADESFWVLADARGVSFLHCRSTRPRGAFCEETKALVNYICELSQTLVEQAPPAAILEQQQEPTHARESW